MSKIKEKILNYLKKQSLYFLLKLIKFDCGNCQNYKWIDQSKSDFNWGWQCVLGHKYFSLCEGKDFKPNKWALKKIEEY